MIAGVRRLDRDFIEAVLGEQVAGDSRSGLVVTIFRHAVFLDDVPYPQARAENSDNDNESEKDESHGFILARLSDSLHVTGSSDCGRLFP